MPLNFCDLKLGHGGATLIRLAQNITIQPLACTRYTFKKNAQPVCNAPSSSSHSSMILSAQMIIIEPFHERDYIMVDLPEPETPTRATVRHAKARRTVKLDVFQGNLTYDFLWFETTGIGGIDVGNALDSCRLAMCDGYRTNH